MSSRKRRLTIMALGAVVVALVAIVAASVGFLAGVRTSTPDASGPGHPVGVPDSAVAYTVDRVVDGDTLRAHARGANDAEPERIRLIGIDTPELHPEPQCGAETASDRLRELLPDGSTAWAVADTEPRDRYDRALLYLWNTDGAFVNLELVTDGSARTLPIKPNTRYATDLAQAEAAARADIRGLWGTCAR